MRGAAALIVVAVLGVPVALTGCGSEGNAKNDNLVAGKQQFVKNCGSCHTLARAGSTGVTGPNLDQAFQQSIKDGFGRDAISGVVKKQILFPNMNGVMPAKLVEGQAAQNIAAYVSYAVARPGKDVGTLATAVPVAGAGQPAVAKNGVLSIAADPNGQTKYVTKTASAPAGPVTLQMPNTSGTVHDLAVQSGTSGPILAQTPQIPKGVAKAPTITLAPGTYTYFCTLPGHRASGMFGTLTVK